MDQQTKTSGTLSCVTKVKSIAPLFKAARAIQIHANNANKLLTAAMFEWLQEQIPVGTIIDLRHKPGSPRPEYLHNVKVVSGNSRGTKLFRIERIRFVEANSSHPDLSMWYADATPISMTTGQDMKGTAGNARFAREFLGLRGYFGFITPDGEPICQSKN